MSTNPPTPPPTQPPAGGQPQYGGQPAYTDPAADAEAAKKKSRNILIGVIVVALAAVVGAFFLGQKTESDKYAVGEPAYNEIYKQGVDSGNAVGTAKGTAKGEAEGKAEGTEAGKKSGVKEGTEQGISEGQQQGASEALGNLTGWDTGAPYAVEFGPGPNANIPFVITSRTLMQAGTLYKTCDSGNGVCTASASSGGGPTE